MISIIFILLAGVCKAIMDKLQFHYENSRFSNSKKYNPQYWNPSISWKNKWRSDYYDINGNLIERFWGSSRWFVFLTDAWHLFQMLFHINIILAIISYTTIFAWYIDFFFLYLLLTTSFSIIYNKLNK